MDATQNLWQSLRFGSADASLEGRARQARHLSALQGCFIDATAYAAAVAAGDPELYYTAGVEEVHGDGQLHYVIGLVHPGKVGNEYYMTKGHSHAWRAAAEVNIGLRGEGLMLLEDERTGESVALPLGAERVVYVPGYTAHRTVNTGSEPLVHWGVLSSEAGHDYSVMRERNFSLVVVEVDGQPKVMDRAEYLQSLGSPA